MLNGNWFSSFRFCNVKPVTKFWNCYLN